MTREKFIISKAFIDGIKILNSAFCEKNHEDSYSEEELWEIAEKVNAECNDLMIDDAMLILEMVKRIPIKRYCIRTNCFYHKPNNYKQDNSSLFQRKCDECCYNDNCKKEESGISNYERT